MKFFLFTLTTAIVGQCVIIVASQGAGDVAYCVTGMPAPVTFGLDWNDLRPAQQLAAIVLGFDEEMWNMAVSTPAVVGENEADIGQNTTNLDGTESVEMDGMEEEMQNSTNGLQGEEMDELVDDMSNSTIASPNGKPNGTSPEEIYGNLPWKELPPDIMAAYQILGYEARAWDDGRLPDTFRLSWNELTPEQQEAAMAIGYNEEMWNIMEISEETEIPVEGENASVTPSPGDEALTTPFQVGNPAELYGGMDWDSMPEMVRTALKNLGWFRIAWNAGTTPETFQLAWNELSDEQRNAAIIVGWTEETWFSAGSVHGFVPDTAVAPDTAVTREGDGFRYLRKD